ncbi:MAG: DNA-formamidopyrimidine glycosylase, partial [Anaeroplasmataceae bacterium]|nr:DNA-formamidopyrimidine glycosylase [Anaeroplasmataceae bacterium]
MPELPEVEVVRQVLKQSLIGKTILKIDCFYSNIIEGSLKEFKSKVENKKITDIKRYAKYLIFILEEGAFLSHLRMEGKYFYLPKNHEPMKHIHVIFHLDNGYDLLYADVRKFGRMEYKRVEEIYSTPPLSKLGIEANAKSYDIKAIVQKMSHKNKTIKEILLDQTILSGLGNIYVDEVLHASGISPLTKGRNLKEKDIQKILDASKEILDHAIELKGTTIRSYTSSLGVIGGYQNFLQVHTQSI